MEDENGVVLTCLEPANIELVDNAKGDDVKKIDPEDLPASSLENEKEFRKETEANLLTTQVLQRMSTSESQYSRRKFRIVGLKFPGKWLQNEKLLEILAKSESFHMWFEKADKDGVKTGGTSIVFETTEKAKAAFSTIHKLSSDCFKLEASKQFYDCLSAVNTSQLPRNLPFKVDTSDTDCPRRLYAIHLTLSTDHTLLSSIFGSEAIENIHIENDPIIPNEKQAEITFRSIQEANDAKLEHADGFEIDEGDRQSVMRLLTAEEYISYMRCENHPRASFSSSTSANATTVSAVSSQSAPDSLPISSEPANIRHSATVTIEDVISLLKQHISNTRTNWAELSELHELWRLCDEVSHKHHGIPDSLLKPALLNILNEHQRSLPNTWLRQHIDFLIKTWKHEVQNPKSMQRSTAYVMSAPPHSPPPLVTKAKNLQLNKDGRRALKTIMGVGAMLNKLRSKMVTEEGELDIEEDEQGNILIDGQELSFDMWGKVFKENTVTSVHPLTSEYTVEKKNENIAIDARKRKLIRERNSVMYENDTVNSPSSSKVDQKEIRNDRLPANVELEEGEMESSSSSSSASSSTSSSSSSDGEISSKDRRSKKRIHKKRRMNPSYQFSSLTQNPQLTALFTQMYDQRHALIRSLSLEHKTAFAKVLSQILQSPREMTSTQQNMISMFIRNFSKQNFTNR